MIWQDEEFEETHEASMIKNAHSCASTISIEGKVRSKNSLEYKKLGSTRLLQPQTQCGNSESRHDLKWTLANKYAAERNQEMLTDMEEQNKKTKDCREWFLFYPLRPPSTKSTWRDPELFQHRTGIHHSSQPNLPSETIRNKLDSWQKSNESNVSVVFTLDTLSGTVEAGNITESIATGKRSEKSQPEGKIDSENATNVQNWVFLHQLWKSRRSWFHLIEASGLVATETRISGFQGFRKKLQ